MGFWDHHVLKSTREYCADQLVELDFQYSVRWRRFKIALLEAISVSIYLTSILLSIVLVGVVGTIAYQYFSERDRQADIAYKKQLIELKKLEPAPKESANKSNIQDMGDGTLKITSSNGQTIIVNTN